MHIRRKIRRLKLVHLVMWNIFFCCTIKEKDPSMILSSQSVCEALAPPEGHFLHLKVSWSVFQENKTPHCPLWRWEEVQHERHFMSYSFLLLPFFLLLLLFSRFLRHFLSSVPAEWISALDSSVNWWLKNRVTDAVHWCCWQVGLPQRDVSLAGEEDALFFPLFSSSLLLPNWITWPLWGL